MDILATLEHFVAIPSWRTPDNPDVEAGVSQFASEVIQREIPWLHVTQQHVDGNRFNVFATDGSPLQILFVGHLDSVPPGAGWETRPTGERVGDRYYGRSSYDVKGGVVALLAALRAVGPTRGIGVLLYCDEEYEFHGMRRFLALERDRAQPALVVALEPTDLRLRTGCRGVCEFRPVVRGKCGHAARPWTGVSALKAFLHGVKALDDFAERHAHSEFGRMTRNIAALRCGQYRGLDGDRPLLAEDSNIIPDYASGVVEVRTLPDMDADQCITAFEQGVRAAGGRLEVAVKRLDFRGFQTPRERVAPFTEAVAAVLGKVEYEEIGRSGYSDIQLLATQFGVPCAIIGPRGGNMHAPDEYVEISSITQLQRVFERALQPHRVGVETPHTIPIQHTAA